MNIFCNKNMFSYQLINGGQTATLCSLQSKLCHVHCVIFFVRQSGNVNIKDKILKNRAKCYSRGMGGN